MALPAADIHVYISSYITVRYVIEHRVRWLFVITGGQSTELKGHSSSEGIIEGDFTVACGCYPHTVVTTSSFFCDTFRKGNGGGEEKEE